MFTVNGWFSWNLFRLRGPVSLRKNCRAHNPFNLSRPWNWYTKYDCQDTPRKTYLSKVPVTEHSYPNKVTLKQLQELTGLLNFCVRAIPAGRAFIRRLYVASCGLKKPHHRRRVNNEMIEDIYTWLFFLNRFNGITSYRQVDWANDCDLELFTYSAGNPDLGCGAVFGSHWVYLLWPQKRKSLNNFSDITFWSLYQQQRHLQCGEGNFLGKR